MASLLAQALINLGPVLVKVLAPAKDEQITSAFLASLVVSRVPVFMFQAVQAAFLPKLAGHAGSGEATRLAADTRRLTVAVGVLCVVATIGAAVLGPPVVRIAFGEDFALRSRDFALLAGASSVYLLALTLAQALIALEFQARVALGWLAGVVAFGLGIALVGGIPFRIEIGFLAGTVAATAPRAASSGDRRGGPDRGSGAIRPVACRGRLTGCALGLDDFRSAVRSLRNGPRGPLSIRRFDEGPDPGR